ncbi:MAG: DMT family transporter [Desulfovibrionaceae bacterium]|nr:DMT family transporter [Desulfovibrionaceae bacterium]
MNARFASARVCCLLILLQSVLFGLMDALLKIVYRDVPVSCFLAFRFLLAVLVFLAFWRGPILSDLKRAPLRRYLLPCVSMAASTVACNMAVHLTAVSTVGFLRSLSCALTPLLLIALRRRPCTARELVLCGLVMTGLYLLCAKNGLPVFGPGEILAFLAALLVACALICSADSLHYVSAVTLSFLQCVSACAICLVLGLVQDGFTAEGLISLCTPRNLSILIYGTLGCTVGGYLLQNIALSSLSARSTGLLQGTYPVCTAAAAWLLLGESMSASGIAGAALVLVCIWASAGDHAQTRSAHAPAAWPPHSARA